MTAGPAIRAALDAAGRAECIARAVANECDPVACPTVCPWCKAGSAAAVAAFLRANAPDTVWRPSDARYMNGRPVPAETLEELAAAVEAAAREAGG